MAEREYSKTSYFWLPPRPSPLAREILSTVQSGGDALEQIDLLIATRLRIGPKPLLIGIAATGWTFQFRGYRTKHEMRSAGLRRPIVSAFDWRTLLKRGFIFDENSRIISPEEFWERVKRQGTKRVQGRLPRNPTIAFQKVRNKELRAQASSSCWIDEEGYALFDETW